MPRNHKRSAWRQVALDEMQIGAADAAGQCLNQELPLTRFRHKPRHPPQGPTSNRPRLIDGPHLHLFGHDTTIAELQRRTVGPLVLPTEGRAALSARPPAEGG